MDNDIWDTLEEGKTPAGKPLPRSVWDKLPPPARPFGWATPRRNINETFPEPWRTSNKDKARFWILHSVLPEGFMQPNELYTDFYLKGVAGKEAIWVGDRNNRNKEAHQDRLMEILKALKALKVPCKGVLSGGGLSGVLIYDDLKSHPFK